MKKLFHVVLAVVAIGMLSKEAYVKSRVEVQTAQNSVEDSKHV